MVQIKCYAFAKKMFNIELGRFYCFTRTGITIHAMIGIVAKVDFFVILLNFSF